MPLLSRGHGIGGSWRGVAWRGMAGRGVLRPPVRKDGYAGGTGRGAPDTRVGWGGARGTSRVHMRHRALQ